MSRVPGPQVVDEATTATTAPAAPTGLPVDDLPWWRAATLPERLAAPGTPVSGDSDRAAFRTGRWRSLPAFRDERPEDEVLEPLGVTADELWALLAESDESLRSRLVDEPAWLADLRSLWSAGRDHHTLHDLGLLEVVRPAVEGALAEVVERAEAVVAGREPGVRDSVRSMVDAIVAAPPVDQLAMLCSPTMVLELNVARVEERLGEGTPEDRFSRFVALLAQDDVRHELLSEYVVLLRLVTTRLRFWVDRRVDLVEAYVADLPRLSTTFWSGAAPTVTAVEFGAGDSHREGRSVAIIRTSGASVVYKPRSVDLDAGFDRLLAWTNEHLPESPLRRLAVVGDDEKTWTEFVDVSISTDADGAERYARRLGRLTALLYVMHSTDFHFENVMASGDDPVLVDLEALFHVEPVGTNEVAVDEVVNAAATVLGESVRSIGILPDRIVVTDAATSYAVDVSAVGGKGGEPGLVEVPTIVDAGLDTMRIDAQRHTVPAQSNAPSDDSGTAFDLVAQGGPFLTGFTEAYEVLVDHAADLLADDGPLSGFAEATVRHIARPTFLYGRLLLKSMHPDFQRDALDQLMFLGKLLSGHPDRPDRVGVIRAEVADLMVGDIPIFSVEVGTGDLFSSDGTTALGRRVGTPWEAVRRRVEGLGQTDLRLQTSIVEASFVAASIDGEVDRWPGWSAARPEQAPSRDELVDAATTIAHELVDDAVERHGHLGWIGLNLVDERWWTLSPTSLDLYAGVPGIGLALSAVAEVSGDPRITEVADRTMDQVAEQARLVARLSAGQVAKRGVAGMDAGAFGLVGGTMYALASAAAVRDRPDWAMAGAQLLDTLGKLVDIDDNADIVSGSAGALLAGLAVEPYADGAGLALAHRAARRLRETAVDAGAGALGWESPVADGRALVGFSHGTLGVAVALNALHEADPGADVADLLTGALLLEDRYFDDATGDSADLRAVASGRGRSMRAWCHGAGGGALGRSALLRHPDLLPDPDAVARQRDRAVEALWDTGLGEPTTVHGIGNHCLCHGDLGNYLAATRSGASPRDDAGTTLGAILAGARTTGWLCGVPGGVRTPGLMTGVAGVAWGLAQIASGHAYPDLLTLTPGARP